MLPRGTVWSLFSLIPNGPKLEYYFSIFGIHIITTLGSIFLIQNSTLYDSLSLPVHQICLGGHGVGCGTGHSQQGKDSCCCVICITVTRTSMQGTHAFLNSAAVGTVGYDWRDEGFELTRGRWLGHWALQDLLATSRGIWYQKNFQKQAYSVWEGGRLFQREGQRLCKRSRSPSLKYYLLQLVPIPVELMTSSSITLGSLRLLPVPPPPKKCKARDKLIFPIAQGVNLLTALVHGQREVPAFHSSWHGPKNKWNTHRGPDSFLYLCWEWESKNKQAVFPELEDGGWGALS